MSFGLTIKNICSSTTLSVNVIRYPILVSQNTMKFNTDSPVTCTIVVRSSWKVAKDVIVINQVESSQKQSIIIRMVSRSYISNCAMFVYFSDSED